MNRRKSTGQAMVELALVIPILIFMVATFLDLTRAIFYYSSLSNAVREGARYAIVHDPDNAAEIESIVENYLSGIDPNDVAITSGKVALNDTEYININAIYDFDPVTPGLAAILGAGGVITLEAETQMEIAPISK